MPQESATSECCVLCVEHKVAKGCVFALLLPLTADDATTYLLHSYASTRQAWLAVIPLLMCLFGCLWHYVHLMYSIASRCCFSLVNYIAAVALKLVGEEQFFCCHLSVKLCFRCLARAVSTAVSCFCCSSSSDWVWLFYVFGACNFDNSLSLRFIGKNKKNYK